MLLLTFSSKIGKLAKLNPQYFLGDMVNLPNYQSDRKPEGMGWLAVSGLMT